jgi:hypothetical protein
MSQAHLLPSSLELIFEACLKLMSIPRSVTMRIIRTTRIANSVADNATPANCQKDGR